MKGHWTVSILVSILIMGSFGISQQAFAIETAVTHSDVENCDFLSVPLDVHELGNGAAAGIFPFPPDEEIIAMDVVGVPGAACPGSSPPPSSSGIVAITNIVSPPRAFVDVWYVADPETTITNIDGTINGADAFRIDSPDSFGGCGSNCPLIFESLTPDGIFEPGETWHFVIDSYFSIFFLPPDIIASIGVPSGDDSDEDVSSGSIIAFVDEGPPIGGTSIPIDTTALLVAGAQTISPWLILGVIIPIGIGLAVFTIKRR